jgi:hypothetical protein
MAAKYPDRLNPFGNQFPMIAEFGNKAAPTWFGRVEDFVRYTPGTEVVAGLGSGGLYTAGRMAPYVLVPAAVGEEWLRLMVQAPRRDWVALPAARLRTCLPTHDGGLSNPRLSAAEARRPLQTIGAGTLGRDRRGQWWVVCAIEGEHALAVRPGGSAAASAAQWLPVAALTFSRLAAADLAHGPREVQAARPVPGSSAAEPPTWRTMLRLMIDDEGDRGRVRRGVTQLAVGPFSWHNAPVPSWAAWAQFAMQTGVTGRDMLMHDRLSTRHWQPVSAEKAATVVGRVVGHLTQRQPSGHRGDPSLRLAATACASEFGLPLGPLAACFGLGKDENAVGRQEAQRAAAMPATLPAESREPESLCGRTKRKPWANTKRSRATAKRAADVQAQWASGSGAAESEAESDGRPRKKARKRWQSRQALRSNGVREGYEIAKE